jgi:phage-related protein
MSEGERREATAARRALSHYPPKERQRLLKELRDLPPEERRAKLKKIKKAKAKNQKSKEPN